MELVVRELRLNLKSKPKLDVSEWADEFRYLSAEASAEPGKWFTERNEPMRGPMNAICDPDVESVVIMSSSQVGKTETLLNTIAYYMHQDPAPMLLVQPTLEIGEAFSKDRLAPMIRDTPALRGLIGDPRSRNTDNTLLHKAFSGGHITIAGANSPASLSSRPIRIVLFDEVDRYKVSAGTEGDPVNLAKKRAKRFWNRKFVLVSTPGIKGLSRIEGEYERSDKQRGFVPCEDCGHFQILRWAQVRWPTGKPDETYYCCEACGAVWDDGKRWRSLHKIEWRPTAPFTNIRGFHLNEIYGFNDPLSKMVEEFLDARKSPETFKTFVNTSLGESFAYDAEKVDGHQLMSRLEDWGDKAPDPVLAITVGVDVQDDRLEVERVGWGVEEESWSLDHHVEYGDPSGPELWAWLDGYLLTPTERADGTILPVHAAAIDHGGHHAAAVSRFVRDRMRRRVYAIKGMAGPGKPIWPKRASKNNKHKINLFIIGVDPGKDAVYARLKIRNAGPGFCHFPVGRDHIYFDQMTAEQIETKYVKGFATRVYVLPPNRRNEALDLRVYAYAALQSLNVRWGRLLAAQGMRAPVRPPEREPEPQAKPSSDPPINHRTEVSNADSFPKRVLAAQAKPRPAPQRTIRKSGWMT